VQHRDASIGGAFVVVTGLSEALELPTVEDRGDKEERSQIAPKRYSDNY
jgi:hypothetical protein